MMQPGRYSEKVVHGEVDTLLACLERGTQPNDGTPRRASDAHMIACDATAWDMRNKQPVCHGDRRRADLRVTRRPSKGSSLDSSDSRDATR
jgi:hypothetical protein